MASFRNPGPLGMEGATLPATGTLARYSPSRPGILGYDLPRFARGAAHGLAAGTPVGGNRGESPLPRTGADLQAATRRLEQDKAIAALPVKSDDFNFQGRIYRVIRSTDWGEFSNSERYQIIPRDEARTLVQAMMLNLASSTAHRAAFKAVLDLIGDSNRGPSESGLLLLHAAPTLYVKPASTAPAVTPSQLAKARRAAAPDTEPAALEQVDPIILGAPDALDSSDDGFTPEPEPSEENGDSGATEPESK